MDGQWYKFNDTLVTKCSTEDAIEKNWGDGSSKTNAYMLIYVLDKYIEKVICDVPTDPIPNKLLIEKEIKIENRILSYDDMFELTIFTAEKLQLMPFERGDKLFDSKNQKKFIKIYVERDNYLHQIFECIKETMNLSCCNVVLFRVYRDGSIMGPFDIENNQKKLKEAFKSKSLSFFAEITAAKETIPAEICDRTKQAMIFIKEYIASQKIITFFGYSYFPPDVNFEDIEVFIRQSIEYDGDDDNQILFFVEHLNRDQYSNDIIEKETIIADVASKKSNGMHMGTIVFETIKSNSNSKFHVKPVDRIDVVLRKVGESNTEEITSFEATQTLHDITRYISEINEFAEVKLYDSSRTEISVDSSWYTIQDFMSEINLKVRATRSSRNKLVFYYRCIETSNTIDRHDENRATMNTECESHHTEQMETDEPSNESNYYQVIFEHYNKENYSYTYAYDSMTPIADILDKFTSVIGKTRKDLQFTDSERQLIFDGQMNLGEFTVDRIVTIYYKDINQNDRQIEMEIDNENEEEENIEHFISRDYGKECDISREDEEVFSIPKEEKEEKMSILFRCRIQESVTCNMIYNANTSVLDAFQNFAEDQQVEFEQIRFFDLNQHAVTREDMKMLIKTFLHKSKSYNYTESCLDIYYDIFDSQANELCLHRLKRSGLLNDVVKYPISESTTVNDILLHYKTTSEDYRMVKIKDGIIHEIVNQNTKATELLEDEIFEYRLDAYRAKSWCSNSSDTFHVCVRFIKDCPEERLIRPILLEVEENTTLHSFAMRMASQIEIIQANRMQDQINSFEIHYNDRVWTQIIADADCGNEKLHKRSDNKIEVIEVNLNVAKNNLARIENCRNYAGIL